MTDISIFPEVYAETIDNYAKVQLLCAFLGCMPEEDVKAFIAEHKDGWNGIDGEFARDCSRVIQTFCN